MMNTFHFISATNHNTTSHLPKNSVRWTKGGRLGTSRLKGEAIGEFPGDISFPCVPNLGLFVGLHIPAIRKAKSQERVGHDRHLIIMPSLKEATFLCPPKFTQEAGFIDGRLCSKPFSNSKVAAVEHMGQDISIQHC